MKKSAQAPAGAAPESPPAEDQIEVTMLTSMSGAKTYSPGDPYLCGRTEAIRLRDAGMAKFED